MEAELTCCRASGWRSGGVVSPQHSGEPNFRLEAHLRARLTVLRTPEHQLAAPTAGLWSTESLWRDEEEPVPAGLCYKTLYEQQLQFASVHLAQIQNSPAGPNTGPATGGSGGPPAPQNDVT